MPTVQNQSPYRFVTKPRSSQQTPGSSRPTFQSSQFSRSAAAAPSSSGRQFAAKPRFSSTQKSSRYEGADDNGIDDPHTSSSPPLPSRLRFSSSLVTTKQNESIDDDEETELSHATIKEKETEIDTDSPGRESEQEDDSDLDWPKTPSPRKKRRLLDRAQMLDELKAASENHKVIQISSSPEPEAHDHESPTPSPVQIKAHPTFSTAKTPRFRPPAAPSAESTSSHRPVFKLPPAPTPTDTEPATPLPQLFSPSHRNRKGQDYVPGGMAAEMRSWIVGMASQQDPKRSKEQYVLKMVVGEVSKSAGMTLVRESEGEGRRVMLLGEPMVAQGVLEEGCRVGLKGPLTWTVELAGEEWICGAQWDILRSS